MPRVGSQEIGHRGCAGVTVPGAGDLSCKVMERSREYESGLGGGWGLPRSTLKWEQDRARPVCPGESGVGGLWKGVPHLQWTSWQNEDVQRRHLCPLFRCQVTETTNPKELGEEGRCWKPATSQRVSLFPRKRHFRVVTIVSPQARRKDWSPDHGAGWDFEGTA